MNAKIAANVARTARSYMPLTLGRPCCGPPEGCEPGPEETLKALAWGDEPVASARLGQQVLRVRAVGLDLPS